MNFQWRLANDLLLSLITVQLPQQQLLGPQREPGMRRRF